MITTRGPPPFCRVWSWSQIQWVFFLTPSLRLLLKVTTRHQKLPKMAQNSIISTFFARWAKKGSDKGWSPPHELEVGPRSGPYLLVLCKYPMNTLQIPYYNSKISFVLHFLDLLHKMSVKMRPKKIYDKTPYVWGNKFTPTEEILHNRWLWWLRHLEGLWLDFYYLIISISASVSESMLGIEVWVDMTVPIRLAGPPVATMVWSRMTVVTVICTEAVDVDCRGSVRTV
jgi:hypothetical protein